jgi:uncharacterized metal-binding protein
MSRTKAWQLSFAKTPEKRDLTMKTAKASDKILSCIDCVIGNCETNDKLSPEFCLTENLDQEVLAKSMQYYLEEENQKIARESARVEADYYCQITRIEEIMEFARRMGYKKLGIATCIGLLKEARIAAKIFRKRGLKVYGAACKVGSQPKAKIGIDKCCEKVGVNMCNPILQAQILNQAKTEFNIIIGLCVGHDSLFSKYSQAPVTTLVVKDRVLGHNPVAALYLSDTYYEKLYRCCGNSKS